MSRIHNGLFKAAILALAFLVATMSQAGCAPRRAGKLTATASARYTRVPTATRTATATLFPTMTPSPRPSETLTPIPSPTSTPAATRAPAPTATPLLQPTPDGISRTLRIPILMYHYISAPPEGADDVRRDLSLPPELFEAQLKHLTEQGYTSITLTDLVMALQTGSALPPKPVIITLDDGYRDAFTNAYPLLVKYHMKATVFIITGLVDDSNPEYLTWAQVAEMSTHDIDIESHSVNHPDLRNHDAAYIQHELRASKQAIEARIGHTVRFFCYPSGDYDADVMALLPGEGYWAAVTTVQGIEQATYSLYELVRLRVRGYFNTEQLDTLLNGF